MSEKSPKVEVFLESNGKDVMLYHHLNFEKWYLNIDDAEQLWQTLMNACHAYRRQGEVKLDA